MRWSIAWRWSALLLLLGGVVLSAKGQTRRLLVTGGSLQAPVEITNPEALASVWGGDFLGTPTSAPESQRPHFTVSFYVVPPLEKAERLMYVVIYIPDENGEGAVVCLPGRGESHYSLNVRTILRAAQDGNCFRGEVRWSRTINAALQRTVVGRSNTRPSVKAVESVDSSGMHYFPGSVATIV